MSSNHLPARLDTDQLFGHFETTHRMVMDAIQKVHDLCDDATDEGQALMSELETVAEQVVAGYEDVKILKFRNSLMENTIKEVNKRQAEQLERIERLETMIVTPHEVTRKHEKARDKYLTSEYNRVAKTAHIGRGNGH